MPINIQNLRNNKIYSGKTGTLAQRIDFAWSIYSNADVDAFKSDDREKALKFLIYAFDINDVDEVNGQLIQLMEERNKHKATNPEYIPGKSPTRIPFNPRKVVPIQSHVTGRTGNVEVDEAIEAREILDVDDHSKGLDHSLDTIFLTPEQRAEHRVHIRAGKLQKNGKDFDTSSMISHQKKGYAAYTLNVNGELSVFNHRCMKDRYAHSSMNAGVPVVAAGEIKVEKGVLKSITTHSGHYQPSLFNIYRLLEHLSDNKVDISQAKIMTFSNPSNALGNVQSKAVYYKAYMHNVYETPSNKIYSSMSNIITKNVESISNTVHSYKKGGLISSLFKLKDKLTRTKLTRKRAELADEFEAIVNNFKLGIRPDLTKDGLEEKTKELESIIMKYEDRNNTLSIDYHKRQNSGRFASKLRCFKKQLAEMKAEQPSVSAASISSKGKSVF